jgi:hypothetical protein
MARPFCVAGLVPLYMQFRNEILLNILLFLVDKQLIRN